MWTVAISAYSPSQFGCIRHMNRISYCNGCGHDNNTVIIATVVVIIIMPHHNTVQMLPVATDGVEWSVGLSVTM